MLTVQESICFALTATQQMMNRFVGDLSAAELLHRPVPAANCAAWLLGHLVLTERRALGALGAGDLPALPDGFESRFSRDEGKPQSCDFGDVSPLLPLWNAHRDRTIAAVRTATPELLEKPLERRHPLFTLTGQMAQFMALHTTLHLGQISTIRRSLGRPPVM